MWRRDEPYLERDFTGPLHLLRAVQEGHRPKIPSDCPQVLVKLMKGCWDGEPEKRLTAEEAIAMMAEEAALQMPPFFGSEKKKRSFKSPFGSKKKGEKSPRDDKQGRASTNL
jgi:hypothetical protein